MSSPAYMGAERGRSIIGSFLRFLLSTFFLFEKVLTNKTFLSTFGLKTHRCSWCYWLLFRVSCNDNVHLEIPFEMVYMNIMKFWDFLQNVKINLKFIQHCDLSDTPLDLVEYLQNFDSIYCERNDSLLLGSFSGGFSLPPLSTPCNEYLSKLPLEFVTFFRHV